MKRLGLVIGLAMIMAVPLAASATAGDHRPMAGGFTVGVVPTEQRCGAAALTLGFEGTGIATHLGAFTGAGTNCTSFDFFTNDVPIYDGIATFVAPDGSTLTTHYSGTQRAPVGVVAAVEATHIVVGGTGRFVGASGVWESAGTIDFATGTSTSTLSGWVSY